MNAKILALYSLALYAATLAACSTTPPTNPVDAAVATFTYTPSNALVIARPYSSQIPEAYDATKPTPLVVLLHGYSADGYTQAAYFGLLAGTDAHGYLLAYPDGTKDTNGLRFWNATDACCNFDHSPVDDVAYVSAVISDMQANYNVDARRIYIAGHSNGAFMSHRMACDRASTVAAIVALAGDDWLDTSKCAPTGPVAILQVHGDADAQISYTGGMASAASSAYPSAHDSVAGWATKNGCTGPIDTTEPAIDLDATLAGAETAKQRWTACTTGGAAELWTIHGGSHLPNFIQPVWPDAIWTWFAAHPKP